MEKRNPEKKPAEVQPWLLTIPQVAALLGVHRSKVYSLIQRDGLPTVKLGERSERKVYRSSLEQWIKQQES